MEIDKAMKKTLCLTCEFGLCREIEYYDEDLTESRPRNKCLLGNDYVEVIVSCTKYKKGDGKVTYHDPGFEEFEKNGLGESDGKE